ncbi:MAG: gmhB [Verrucomicrobiales bacterium]|nr:gmhB [Verrucomicrobiales bacterium]
MKSTLKPALFFDRDGVVNVSPGAGYVTSVEDFHLMPGIAEVLAWGKTKGFFLVLVTSQQGVGKGLMTQETLDAIHAHLQETLAREGASFDLIRSCTHLAGSCDCRKPSPQMILDAASILPINLAASALVGDHDRDIQMARNAGLAFAVRLASDNPVSETGDVLAHSILEVWTALKNWEAKQA